MEVSGQFQVSVALPPAFIGQEVAWDPEPVWTLWGTDESLALAGNRIMIIQNVARYYIDWDIPAPLH
jgi:hypothetical protein